MNLEISSSPRAVRSIVLAAVALLAALPQAWAGASTFTVGNSTFPSTAVGNSFSQNVTLTVNIAVPITSITIAPNFTEYTIGTITGCTIDPTGVTIVPATTVCTIPVRFTPSRPGSAAAPPPISRSAPLLVKDVESGKPNGYSFALTGSATGPVFAFAPGYNTAVVGNSTFVGGFTAGCTNQTDANGDGCPATDALIYPTSMAVDPAGNLYISDGPLYVVHRVDAVTGIISIYAGQYKQQGPSGSGGQATSAKFFNPGAIALDQAGNVYLDDPVSGLWEINPASGIATIIAGGGPNAFAAGNTAKTSLLPYMYALLVDPAGNIYFSVAAGTVYRIDAATDKISIVAGAGNGTSTFPATGYPGVATSAKLGEPEALAMDSSGNLYIGDVESAIVFEVNTLGNISAVAGTQAVPADHGDLCTADSGNWGPATSAFVGFPAALALDPANNLYIGEPGSQAGTSCPVRRVDASTGIIYNVAGDTTNTYGFEDNAGAFDTYLSPNLVAVDGDGNIYVGQQNISSGVSKILSSESSIIFPRQSQFVTGLQLVTASNVGVSSSLDFLNYPFPIIPVPSSATPTPFSNLLLAGNTPQDCAVGILPAGGVCGIQVAFNPTANAVVNATETVEDNSLSVGGTNDVININGNAYNGATTTLAPSPITFSSQAVGTPTAAMTVGFSIILSPTITFSPITIGGPNASSFQISTGSNQCTSGLALSGNGGTCNIYVIFDPQSGGALSGTLNVTYTADGVTYSMTDSITGTGVAPPQAATPVISPAGGTYNAPVAVQITDASPSPTIYYTTTGTAPVAGTSPTYTGVFDVTTSGTEVQAIAMSAGDVTSNPATPATYTVNPVIVFNAAAAGATSPQQLIAMVSLAGTTVPTASLHYGHDYTLDTLSCTPNVGIEVCTVPINFVPTLPGARKDALFLMNGSTRVATVLLEGLGQAPMALIQPGVITQAINNGGNALFGSVVDENGTAYILDSSLNSIFTLTKAGVQGTLPMTGLSSPRTISIDGAGVLYVHNGASDSVVLTYDTVQAVQSTKPLPGTHFWATSVGDAGNLYAVDQNDGVFYVIKPDGTNTSAALSPSIAGPAQLAVDSSENVFIGGATTNEITAGGTQTGFSDTDGINAVLLDAAGTLYAAPYSGYGGLPELPATNYNGTPIADIDSTVPLTIGGGIGSDGTVFVGTQVGLDKVDRSHGAISFGAQTVNGASTLQTVSLYNGGNLNLTLSNFVLAGSASGFALHTSASNPCSVGMTILPGALCNVAVTLTPPSAGTFSGSITFTSNTLNVASTNQTVALSGFVNGINVIASPNPLNFANQLAGTSSGSQSVTLTNSGTSATATISTPLPTPSGYSLGIGNCNTPIPANGGTCQLSVTFSPALAQAYDDLVSLSAISNGGGPSPQTVSFNVNGLGLAPVPVASLSTTPIAFTNQVVGSTSAPLSATLSNTGNGPLSISGITTGGTYPTDFAVLTTGTNACGATLPANATCNIYVAFTPASAASFTATLQVADNGGGSPQTLGLSGTGVTFVSNVGTAEAAQAVTVNITTAGTLHSIQVLTRGAANLDFTETSGGTCTTTTPYSAGQSCTVNVIFDPQAPGALLGAVILTNNSNAVLGTTYLPGLGIGPELTFGPGVQSTPPAPSSGYGYPFGVAVDAGRNLYVTNSQPAEVIKVPWTGTSYGTPVPLPFTGLIGPEGVVVDGGGNVFITDASNRRIIELPWNGTSYGTQIVLDSSGLNNVEGIVVDGVGNLFFSDAGNNVLIEMAWTASGFGSPTTITAATGLHSPNGLATDANRNIYIADSSNNRVVEIPWNGTGFGTEIVLPASNLAYPVAVALDGAGDVYILNNYVSSASIPQMVEEPWNGTAFGTQITVPFSVPQNEFYGLAVDSNGNLFLVDYSGSNFYELNVSTPPSLNFASTNVGSVSSDSPKTVVVTNIGNGTAGIDNVVSTTDFKQDDDANYCVGDGMLTPGSSCDISVDFKPTTTGPLSENVVLTVNLNGVNVTQNIAVSGTGVGVLTAQAINFTQPTTPVTWSSGLTIPLVATGGGSGNAVVFSIDGSSTGAGSVSGSTLTVTSAGSFVIDANQAGNSSYSAAPQVQRTLVVNKATQTINFTQPTTPVIYSGTSLTVPLSATGGASGNAVVFTIDGSSTATGSISGSTLTVRGTGNLVIDANQAGNTNYSVAPQVQRTVVVNAPTPQAISFTQPTTPVTYASGLQIALSATGGASGNPVVFTIDAGSTAGAGSISGSTLTVNTPGTIVIDANQAGSSTYSAAPQVQRTVVVSQATQTINFTQPSTPVIYSGTSLTVPLSGTGGASGNPVVFTIDASSTATGSISGSTLTVTSTGNLVVDANQAGNTDYSAAPKVQRTVVVNAPTPQAINFAQPTTPITFASGLAVPLTATGGGSGNPVVFTIDASSTGTGSISGSTLTVTGVGILKIDANQAGNASYTAAPQVARTVVVNQASQTIAFTQPTTPATYSSGLQITLSATGGASGNAVVFTLDATSTATGTVSGSTITVTSVGTLVIDANQAGNTNYSAAPQVQKIIAVNAPPPDFTVTPTTPSQTVAPGASAMYSITVADVGSSFNGIVTLSVSGLPTGATGSFNPTTVTPGSGSATSMLTVTTPAVASLTRPNLWPMATPVLALLFMLPLRRWRRVWRGRLLLLVAGLASLAGAASFMGCGGGFGANLAQTYTLTVTGTSGSDTHSTTVQLTVQ